MAKRLIGAIRGYVHDIDKISALSADACNIRFLSDRALYVLQNLAGLDATFLSRYGRNFDDDEYTPVAPNSNDAQLVSDTYNQIRSELSMNCVDQIIVALNGIKNALSSSSCGCEVGEGADTEAGQEGGAVPEPVGSIEFQEPVMVSDRKCKAANSIHQTLTDVFTSLSGYPVEDFAGLGLVFSIGVVAAVLGALATPVVGLIIAVAGLVAVFASKLIVGGIDLGQIANIMDSEQATLVCILYNATDVDSARDEYLAELVNQGLSTAEITLVELLMSNAMMNLLFFDTDESAAYWDGYSPPVDCSSCAAPEGSWELAPSGWWGATVEGGGAMGEIVGGGSIPMDGTPVTLRAVKLEGQNGWVLGIRVSGVTAIGNGLPSPYKGGQVDRTSGDIDGWWPNSTLFYCPDYQPTQQFNQVYNAGLGNIQGAGGNGVIACMWARTTGAYPYQFEITISVVSPPVENI